VRRNHVSFSYRAGTWSKPRRVVAKVEWHPSELYPRVGFVVTNMTHSGEWVVAFYNQRGTADQRIKEGKTRSPGPVCPVAAPVLPPPAYYHWRFLPRGCCTGCSQVAGPPTNQTARLPSVLQALLTQEISQQNARPAWWTSHARSRFQPRQVPRPQRAEGRAISGVLVECRLSL
jgi:hypothetical protein